MNDKSTRQRRQDHDAAVLPLVGSPNKREQQYVALSSPQKGMPLSPLHHEDADTTPSKGHHLGGDYSYEHHFGQQYMLALTLAGMCSSLLSTIFGLFHVDVFLRVYQLPLHAYSTGSIVFSIINTANDVLGAWLLDAVVATNKMDRSDMIGVSGVIFCVCFL